MTTSEKPELDAKAYIKYIYDLVFQKTKNEDLAQQYASLIPNILTEMIALNKSNRKLFNKQLPMLSDLSEAFEDPATGLQTVRDYLTVPPITDDELKSTQEAMRNEAQKKLEEKRAKELAEASKKLDTVKPMDEEEFTAAGGEIFSDRSQEALEWRYENKDNYNVPDPGVIFFFKVKRFLKELFDNRGTASPLDLEFAKGVRLTTMPIQEFKEEDIPSQDKIPYEFGGKTASMYERNEPVLVVTDKDGKIVKFNKETGKEDKNGSAVYYKFRDLYPGNFKTVDGKVQIKLWEKGPNAKPKTIDDYERAKILAGKNATPAQVKKAEEQILKELNQVHRIREAIKKDPSVRIGLEITSITPGYIKYDLGINTPMSQVDNAPSTFQYSDIGSTTDGTIAGDVHFTVPLVGNKRIVLERSAIKDIDGMVEKVSSLLFDNLTLGGGTITSAKRIALVSPFILLTSKGGSSSNIDVKITEVKGVPEEQWPYKVLLQGKEIYDSTKPQMAEAAKKLVEDYLSNVQVQGELSEEKVAGREKKIIHGATVAEVADQFEKGRIFHDTTTDKYYSLGYPKMQLAKANLNTEFDDPQISEDGKITIVQKNYNKDYVIPNTYIHYQLNAKRQLISLNPRITFAPVSGTREKLDAVLNPEKKKVEEKPIIKTETTTEIPAFFTAGKLDSLNSLLSQKERQPKAVQEQLEKAITWYTGLTGEEYQEFEALPKLGMGKSLAQFVKYNTLKTKFDKGAHPIAKVVPLSVMFNAVNTANDKSVATWTKAGITLFQGADYSEIYHEAWHAFTQTFLSQEEQDKLYKEVKNKTGGFIDYKGHYVSFGNASPLQREEYLAEQFREYMLKGGKMNIKSPVQKSIFQKILDYLKALFTGVSVAELNADGKASKVINEMFEKLRIGNLSEYSFDQANANFDVLHTGAIAYDPDAVIQSLNYEDSDMMVRTIDGLLSQFVDLVTDIKRVELNTKSSKWTSTLLKNPDGLKLGYLHAKQVLEKAMIPLNAKYEKEKVDGDTLEAEKTLRLLNLYDWTIKQLGDTSNLMNNRPGKGESPKGMIAYHQAKSKILAEEDKEAFFSEDAMDETDLFIRGRERASQEILFLFNSLQKVDSKGDKVFVPGTEYTAVVNEQGDVATLGVPVMEDFDRIWNRVVKTLENEINAEKMFTKLDVLADTAKSLPIKQLLKKLGSIENKDKEEVHLWTNFWQTFNKARVPLLQTTVSITTKGEDGSKISFENMSFSVRPGRASSDTTKIKGFWKNLFLTGKMEDGSTNYYIVQEKDSGRRYLNVSKVYNDFIDGVKLKTGADRTDFFRALGLHFDYDNVDITKAINSLPNSEIERWTKRIANLHYRDNVRLYNLEDIALAFPEVPTRGNANKTQGKLDNEAGNLKQLLEIQAKYSDKWGNFMVSNAEGNTQFEHTLNNFLTITVNSLNDAESYADLMSKPWMKHLDIKHNPQAAASAWLKSMFDMEGYIKGTSNGERKEYGKGKKVMINLENLSGIAVEKDGIYDDDLGIASANADPVAKLIMDFHMMLLKGAPELMRHADKSTSFTAFLNHISMQGAAGNLYVDTMNFTKKSTVQSKGTMGDEFAIRNYMMPNLEAELARIKKVQSIKNDIDAIKKKNPTLSAEELDKLIYEKVGLVDKNYLKNGSSFTVFSDVLTAETKKALKKGTIKYNDTTVQDDMIAYLNKETARVTKMFDKAKRKGKHLFSTEALDKVRKGTDALTENETQALIKSFTVNSWIHNLESINIIYGDLAQYKISSEEFHKRNAGTSSTGDLHRTDNSMIDYVNNVLGKEMSYDATLNTAVLDDVMSVSAYIESYGKDMVDDLVTNRNMKQEEAEQKIYGVEKDKSGKIIKVGTAKSPLKGGILYPYADMEEANAQAWMSFDTYRALQVMRGAWDNDKQEKLYQKLIAGEKISPSDVAKFFPPLKLQYWGPLANTNVAGNTSLNAFHKYSMLPLIPSMLTNTNMLDVAEKMKNEKLDYITFKSGSKMATLSKDSGLDKLYDEKDGRRVVSQKPFTVNKIFIQYLKNQLETGDKFKNQTIFATQLRKLIEDGLVENGIPTDYLSDKPAEVRIAAWNKIEVYDVASDGKKSFNPEKTEEKKQEISPKYKLYKLYEKNLNTLTQVKTKELLEEMGWDIGDDGVPTGPIESLVQFVKAELTKKDLSDHELAFIDVISKGNEMGLKHDLSIAQSAEMIEKMLNNLVGKRLVKQKVNGEGLIQISGVGLESKDAWLQARKGTAEELQKWGTNDLPTYHVGKDGKTVAMKVKVALQGKFKHLLNLKDKEGNRIGTIERLNTLLKDEEWLNTGDHRRMITMVGVRIPVQGLNSMEFMEVYEFLPEEAGNIIVPPAEIVAKSGSDFDIDKLTVFMPSIANYSDGVALIKYDSALAQRVSKKDIQAQLIEQYELKDSTKSFYEEWFDEEKADGVFKTLTPQEQVVVGMIKMEHTAIDEEINKIQEERNKVKSITQKSPSDKMRMTNLTSNLVEAYARKEMIIQSLANAISRFNKEKVAQFKERQSQDLTRIDREIERLKRILNSISSDGVQNDVLWNIKSILELPSNYISLITPNSTDLVKPLATEQSKYRNYKATDRLQGRMSKEDSLELGEDMDSVAGTRVLEIGYNMYKHASNRVGKQVLGIGAVDNTFNTIFNRVGARLVPKLKIGSFEIVQTIRLPHNKITLDEKEGPSISLSHLTNQEGEKISDLISQLINGWVDVAKDAWVFDIEGNEEMSPMLLFLIQAGVPFKTAVYFISQPIIKEFAEEQRLAKSPLGEMLGKGSNPKQYEQTALNSVLVNHGMTDKKYKYSTWDPSQEDTLRLSVNALQAVNDAGVKDLFDQKTLEEAATGKETSEAFQKAIFLHFLEIRAMVNSVRDVKMAMNFDTNRSTTAFEANTKIRKVNEVLNNPRFAWDMTRQILEDSPISSFYVQPLQVTLFKDLFPLRNHPKFLEFMKEVIEDKKYRTNIRDTFGDEDAFGNALQNDFVNFIFQNQLRGFDLTQKLKDNQHKGIPITVEGVGIESQAYLPQGAIFTNGKIHINLKTLNEQFVNGTYATKAYNALGLSSIPSDAFYNGGVKGDNERVKEYYNFVINREVLRARYMENPALYKDNYEFREIQQKNRNAHARIEGEETEAYASRINRMTFEQFIAEKALHDIYNPVAMFTGSATITDKFNNVIKAYPGLLQQYSVLSRLSPSVIEDKSKKKMYTNLVISGEKLDDVDLINLYTSQIKSLGDPTVTKVANKIDNDAISEFFAKLPLVAFMQTGLNTKTSFSITRIMPTDTYVNIMEKGVREMMENINDTTLQKYYKRFLDQNSTSRARYRNRYKDYYLGGFDIRADKAKADKKGIDTLVNPDYADINYITDDSQFLKREGKYSKLFYLKEIESEFGPSTYMPILKSTYTYGELVKFLKGEDFTLAPDRRKPILERLAAAGFDSAKLNQLFEYRKNTSSLNEDQRKEVIAKQARAIKDFMILYTQGLAETSLASDLSAFGDFSQERDKGLDKNSIDTEVEVMIQALKQMIKVKDRYATSNLIHRDIDGNLVYSRLVDKEKAERLLRDNTDAVFIFDGVTGVETTQVKPQPAPVSSPVNNPVDYTNHSGGAKGADEAWHIVAKELGYNTNDIHYREPGQTTVDSPTLRKQGVTATPMSSELYARGKEVADYIDSRLGENPNRGSAHYRYRNYAQVANSDAIFAISSGFGDRGSLKNVPMDRGTVYAVLAGVLDKKPVYVFDQAKKVWMTYDYTNKKFIQTATPKLTKNFAGIGSRTLTEAGKQAIRDVYEKTFKAQQPGEGVVLKSVADIPQNKVSGIESYGSLVTANDAAIKALGPNPHSIDMIEAGFRTRTTRSESEMGKYAVKVGDIVKHFGKSADGTTKTVYAKVTAIHPKGSDGWKGTWTKEGWKTEDVNVIDNFKDGAAAIEFEVIKPVSQASESGTLQPVTPKDRVIKKYPATIEGMDSKLMQEFLNLNLFDIYEQTEEEADKEQYFDTIAKKFGKSAAAFQEVYNELFVAEAEFFKKHPDFAVKLVDAILNVEDSYGDNQDFIKKLLEENVTLVDTYQYDIFGNALALESAPAFTVDSQALTDLFISYTQPNIYPKDIAPKVKSTVGAKGNQIFSQVSVENGGKVMAIPTYNTYNVTKDNIVRDVNGEANPLVVKEIHEALDAIQRSDLKNMIFSEEGYGQGLLGLDREGKKLPYIKETPAKETFLYLSKELYRRFGYVNKNYLNNEAVKGEAIQDIESVQTVSTSMVEEFMKRCK
jgi:hypothetical protein